VVFDSADDDIHGFLLWHLDDLLEDHRHVSSRGNAVLLRLATIIVGNLSPHLRCDMAHIVGRGDNGFGVIFDRSDLLGKVLVVLIPGACFFPAWENSDGVNIGFFFGHDDRWTTLGRDLSKL